MANILKVWLKKNELTPDPNDYNAVVSSVGSISKQGIIDALVKEGVELQRETLEDVVNRYNRVCAAHVLSGWNVDTGLVYMRPVVSGAFYTKKFDPAKNSVYVAVTQGSSIRKEVSDTKVEVLGEMPDMMYIMQVVNMQSKSSDGTLVRGRNAQVEGAYLKLVGDDPAVGVYLTSVGVKNAVETKLDADHIVTNEPSKLLILVPADLPQGAYRLKVVTQFTGSNKQLKAPREAVFGQELAVV
jgi:hypothetical protein